ncbi:hypothetical protein LHYA1_G004928 [Lachnellula hyalina]|uniref:Uncharacterized protein n=1 Tax=Lachnellula hyalina TaxID=1316788 RepID=A0A8H8R1V3_9HELO|nr:uncharacterized protein LHYA1_G004928 [Lachnellula hyalina]TVY26225.1 hypothetical protein LHYA1_G004928 [Lachnellula hyalina]
MDFVNKAKNAISSGGNNSATTQQPATGQTGNAGTEDYGDKGMFLSLSLSQSIAITSFTPLSPPSRLDFVEKKSGHTIGRDTNEKITDGARGLYEKATGSQVNPKYSN